MFTVSVADYAKALSKREPEYRDFMNAFLNYGSYAAKHFDYGAKQTDEPKKTYSEADYAEIAEALTSQGYTGGGIQDEGYIGSSLLLKDSIILRHYFKDTEKAGKYTYQQQAFKPYAFSEQIAGYDYTVYDYICKVLSSDKFTADTKDLCCALYEFGKLAEEFAVQAE